MSLVINTNLNALAAQSSASAAAKAQSKAMQRLSTGMSINSAADDAAGLAIANRMTSNINGLGKAIQNANDGINMAQTADSALSNTTSILQRMRELAVQAANGTSTDANRQAIQAEVSQLKTQIDQIGQTTNFNDINLLDGTAGNVSLQVGVNQGQTMSMGFDSILTKDIGLGSRAALSSLGNIKVSATNTAMSYGDLTVNGVLVGPSLKTSDSISSTLGDSSAIAKAAAINAVSSKTGVTATVTGTTVQGSTMALAAASSTGTITINGVTSSDISTSGTDLSLSRTAVVTAINNMTAETGVTAEDTGNDQHGIQLIAADGRNITFTDSFGANTTIGLNDNGTYSGTYQLASDSNSPITIGSQVGGKLGNANLTAGTYAPNIGQVTSSARAVASASTTIGAVQSSSGKLTSNSLIINGIAIGAAISSDDTASDTISTNSYKAESAIAFAAAVNKSSNLTGVKAVANANVIVGSSFTAGTIGTSIYLNGVTITNTLGTSGYKVADVANLLNAYTGQTGVVASDNGKGLTLTAADGRNISIGESGADANKNALGISSATGGPVLSSAATITAATTTYGTISLQSNKSFTVASGSDGDSNLNLIGLAVGTFGGSANGLKIAQVDVSTLQGAQSAITAIDAALTTVSLNQSNAGAYINRLNDIVTNQTSMQSNMTTSRSAIEDTDYSAETTNLAKSQIISQAATAMLAQANQSSQNVLALLK